MLIANVLGVRSKLQGLRDFWGLDGGLIQGQVFMRGGLQCRPDVGESLGGFQRD
jgi:hypothetical protein